jgi:hypothetical protein
MQVSYWRIFLAGIAIEYAVCLAISFTWNDRDQYWYAGLIMLGLWAVQAALGLKNFIVTTIYYHLFGKTQMANFLAEKMAEADMPYDGENYDFCSDYLHAVLHNEDSTREQIILAAEFIGAMDAVKAQGLVRGWRMIKVSNLAMESYFKKREAWERRNAKRINPRAT